jgi:hypothetical protein
VDEAEDPDRLVADLLEPLIPMPADIGPFHLVIDSTS